MFSLRVKLTRCLDIEEVIVELHGLTGIELEQFLPFCNLAVDIL
jgi:ligand-binding sensor protein